MKIFGKNFIRFSIVMLLFSASAFSSGTDTIFFSMPKVNAFRGDTVRIPVNVSDLLFSDSIYSGDIQLSYDTTVMQILSVQTDTTLLAGPTASLLFNPALKKIGFASSSRIIGSGALFKLVARLLPTATSSSMINLISVQLNEGGFIIKTANGEINPFDRLPQFVNVLKDTSIFEQDSIVISFKAVDPDGDPIKYTLGSPLNNIPGVFFDSLTGIFAWRPTLQQGGIGYLLHVTATDDRGGFSVVNINLTVNNLNQNPQIGFIRDTIFAQENSVIKDTITAFDADFDLLSFSFSNTPPLGLTIVPAGSNQNVFRAAINWIPGFNQAGIYSVTLTVSDNQGGFSTKVIVFNISDVNRFPVFTFPPRDTLIAENIPMTMSLKAIDDDNDTIIYGLSNAPQGMSIDQFNGTISWTPNFTQAGVYVFEVGAGDKKGLPTKKIVTFTVTNVNRTPQFTSVLPDTMITDTTTLIFKYSVVDPDNDELQYFLKNQPPGANIDPIGNFVFRPLPNQVGLKEIIVHVTDGAATIVDTARVMVVQGNNSPFFTKVLPDTTIIVNKPFAFQYTAADPDTFDQLLFGVLFGVPVPPGVTISPNGLLTWIPAISQVGKNQIVVGVSDGKGGTLDTAIVTVLNNRPPQFIVSLPDISISVDSNFSFKYTAVDPDNDKLIFTVVRFPVGAIIQTDGAFSWRPSAVQIGRDTIIVAVSDGFFVVQDTAIVTVQNINGPPKFAVTLPDMFLHVDSTLIFNYSAQDPNNDQLIFSFAKLPSGAVISPGGTFSWKPSSSQVGKHTIVVAVSDGFFVVLDTAVVTVIGFSSATISQNNFDFGSINFGGSRTLSASISNTGSIPLMIVGMPDFNLTPDPNFIIDTTGLSVIAPGAQKTFDITYHPQSVGGHFTAYVFITNDPNNPSIVVTASGSAITKLVVTKKLLVDTLHHSRLSFNDSTSGISQLFKFFEQSGIQISLTGSDLRPSGNDILLLIDPQKIFAQPEIDSIKTFVTNGGLLVALGNSAVEGSSTSALNSLLQNSTWSTGLALDSNLVVDDSSNYNFTAALPVLTTFADAQHPYFTNVDTLVFFRSASITVSGAAIPLVTTTVNGKTIGGQSHAQPVVVGLSKIGKGKILLLGDADVWKVESTDQHSEQQSEPNISIKDNLAFAINVFSVTEDYEVKLPNKTLNERYQLVSIPFDLDNADVSTVLSGLGERNALVWRLFGHYSPSVGKYAEYPSDNFKSIKRGEAYWLITRGEFGLNLGSSTIVPVQSFYPVKIGPGYSMVGNPFPYKVSWKNSLHDSVQNLIWKFDGETFKAESLSLDPFAGYFVKNLSKDSITIYINPEDITSLKKSGYAEAVLPDGEWRIGIKAVSGKSADEENFAGVAKGAKDEFDSYDVAEPPSSPTDYVIVRFQHNSWKEQYGSYAFDIRSINDEGLFWDFDVITAKPQSRVTVNLTEFGDLPNDFELYVVDKTTERVIRIDQAGHYEFSMSKNESRRNFRLIAGKKDFVENNTQGIPLIAVQYSLMQNYPNPFNPSTLIRYTLGHSGHVSLAIFNVLGQQVRSLTNAVQPIGTYEMEWDGKDNSGNTVSTGVYFYKLTVISNGEKAFAETKKLMLLK